MAVHCQHGLAVGDAGDQQQEGFGHHERQREQVLAGGAACVGGAEHRVRGEQRTEQHQVGHEVDPHAEHLHAALLMAVVVCVVVLVRRRIAGQLRAGQQVHALVHVLVVGAHDQGHDHGDEAGGGHPPDVPDQREAQHQAPDVEDQRHAGVLRHVDRRVLLRRRWQATLLRFVEGVQLIGLGHHGEVVERRRRRRGPFQRACIPRVAGQVGGLLAVADRHGHLDDLAQDAGADDEGTCSGHQQQRLVGRVDGALQTTGHAHEAQHVHRHEGHVEADEPAPERALAPELIEAEAEHLRPPVGDAGEHAEHHAADDDVVEVGDQEQAVVQHEVDGRDRQHHAGHAADGEGDHEADGPQHGRGELHATAEHGEQPVEDLHAGRDRDDHRRDAEEGIDVGTRAHGEEVTMPL
ncbi:hypothetical protein G6F59_012932 [Rhizopus arrhizus]|nr:hypothetical protein G6F59_012932 [Rhizopus arrhizus]